MTARTTVRLPEELLERARRKARADGRTLTALIEDGLRLVTAANRGREPAKRVLPRVSSATGGFRVDLTSFSALQDLEDIDYVERMTRSE